MAKEAKMRAIINKNAERLAVQRFLEAIIRDAIYVADLTADFLDNLGWKSSRKKGDTDNVPLEIHPMPKMSPVMLRAHGFLLNLAAALRLVSWERAGLRSELPADLPTANEAFQRLLPPEVSDSSESGLVIPELALQVFRVWLRQFSRNSQASLGIDITLPLHAVAEMEDKLLDILADFLLKNCRLADMADAI